MIENSIESQKIIKDELNYVIFSDLYYKFSGVRAQRKAFHFLEIGISCIYKRGFEGVTLALIGKEAGVTAPAVRYYYPSVREFLLIAVRFVRLRFQEFVLEGQGAHSNSQDVLRHYISRHFLFVDKHKVFANVWLSFLVQCVKSKSLRELNSKASQVGRERLIYLLNDGKKEGVFSFNCPNETADALQIHIMGSLISYASEVRDDQVQRSEFLIQQCLELVGCRVH